MGGYSHGGVPADVDGPRQRSLMAGRAIHRARTFAQAVERSRGMVLRGLLGQRSLTADGLLAHVLLAHGLLWHLVAGVLMLHLDAGGAVGALMLELCRWWRSHRLRGIGLWRSEVRLGLLVWATQRGTGVSQLSPSDAATGSWKRGWGQSSLVRLCERPEGNLNTVRGHILMLDHAWIALVHRLFLVRRRGT